MTNHLTIAYVTSRLEPHLDWFLLSLSRQLTNILQAPHRIVIVDFHHANRADQFSNDFIHVPPKPCVWQGPHRLTQRDFFAAANARNTALCYAPNGWIAFVDDLSVLMPGWLMAVREAMANHYIACGAFRKVNKLVVENGLVKSWEPHIDGEDHRWKSGDDKKAVACPTEWMFGCSLAAPVEAFLEINGYPELCDGMGYEDSITGILIGKHGYQFKYDRRMLTYESEELHHTGYAMLRLDPGTSPNDKSHAMLNVLRPQKTSLNDFDIRGMRLNVLSGAKFPIPKRPTVEWFTKTPLKDL